MDYVLIKYLHFISIFVLVSLVVVQYMQLKPTMATVDLKRLARIDIFYGAAAGLTLITGLTLCFLVGKDSHFYTSNPLFHIKVTTFVLVGLLSIYPSLFLAKNKDHSSANISVPKNVRLIVRAELIVILIMPLLAVLIASGYQLL